jgi:hypothetical protein
LVEKGGIKDMKNNVIKLYPSSSEVQKSFDNSDWSDSYKASATKLSNYVKSLPIDRETNDQLVSLMVENVELAFQEGFTSGYGLNESEQALFNAIAKRYGGEDD